MKPRRILVPLDGRRPSETALLPAADIARESGGRLYLLRVLGTSAPAGGASVRHRAAVQRAQRYLTATRERLATSGVLDVSTAVWWGSPAAAIVKAADLTEADMIIMARGGRTGPPRKLVGSVVERVLCGTRRPVLVVTPPDAIVAKTPANAAPLPDRADGPGERLPHGSPRASRAPSAGRRGGPG